MKTKTARLFAMLAVLALLVPMLAAGIDVQTGVAAKDPKVHVVLTLLHNNDAESRLIDLGAGREDFGGAARFKTLVDELRAEATTGAPLADLRGAKRVALMVSSGDNFLAGAEFNSSLDRGIPFYDTIAMDLIGYDAIAIGNHDFDFGPDVLADFILGFERTRPTYLSSNLDFSQEPRLQALFDQGRIAASVVVKERGEVFGIIGAVTPMLPFISSPRNVVVMADVAAAVQAEVEKLEAMGVNKIILISHLQSVQEDLELAPMLRGVDIMVAGGGDEVLANAGDLLLPGDETIVFGPYPIWTTGGDGSPVPVVTTAGGFGYVGQLIAGFDKQGNLLMAHDSSGPVRVAGGDQPDAVEPDPEMLALVTEPLLADLEERANTVVGTSEVDLDGRRAIVRGEESNEGNLIADSLLWQATQLAPSFGIPVPDVALQNGGGIRNDTIIPAGPLTVLDVESMVPFPNFVSVVEDISREQFKELLENAVSRVEFGDGRFAQVAGFSFVYDAAGTPQVVDAGGNVTTPGTRVREVVLDNGTLLVSGGTVVPGDALTIATIDFLARGGDQYPYRGAPFTTLGVTYAQALQNYIEIGLGGFVLAADYPFGGEGRITRIN
jgi:2',3'-cyclic-nucleotide 2'-phosphodiesterase (5'-nucleotidase family)